jgi:hypothetical protein
VNGEKLIYDFIYHVPRVVGGSLGQLLPMSTDLIQLSVLQCSEVVAGKQMCTGVKSYLRFCTPH